MHIEVIYHVHIFNITSSLDICTKLSTITEYLLKKYPHFTITQYELSDIMRFILLLSPAYI